MNHENEEWLAQPIQENIDQDDEGSNIVNNNRSEIMNVNVQEFIQHYGVVEQSYNSKCVNDLRNLIFGWMGTIDINTYSIDERSIMIFSTFMSKKENFKELYSRIDQYN
jgi:hypothetical protein